MAAAISLKQCGKPVNRAGDSLSKPPSRNELQQPNPGNSMKTRVSPIPAESHLSFDDKSADLLYEVINRRYERKSGSAQEPDKQPERPAFSEKGFRLA